MDEAPQATPHMDRLISTQAIATKYGEKRVHDMVLGLVPLRIVSRRCWDGCRVDARTCMYELPIRVGSGFNGFICRFAECCSCHALFEFAQPFEGQQAMQLAQSRHMGIQRWRANAQSQSKLTHRELVEAVTIGEFRGGGQDTFPVHSCLWCRVHLCSLRHATHRQSKYI